MADTTDESPRLEGIDPELQKGHRTDAIGTKFVEKTGKLQEKAVGKTKDKSKQEEKKPAGGFDKTAIPAKSKPPGYTVKFTFHRASNLPFADFNSLSSDPYLVAELTTSLPPRHKEDPPMRFRTHTVRRNTSPEWNSEWIVANIPPDGFHLKARLYDEDPGSTDDRLGNIDVDVDHVDHVWAGIHEEPYKIKKRMGNKRAYFFRACAAMMVRSIHMSGEVVLSIEVLGKSDEQHGGRTYTLGPCNYTHHLSPLIGRLAGTKNPQTIQQKGPGGEVKKTERYNFEANQIQLRGPVPEDMYHRYVEFKPFVAGMFTSHSLRGRILNRALHHQHSRIYNYDQTTQYGSFPAPCDAMTRKFLELVHRDQGGRIFTYVLLLDGLWRFTETGKEFGIDMLSKHTMHSNVSNYIAFSGEFFIRRLKDPDRPFEQQQTHPPSSIGGGPPDEPPPGDPEFYQLIIDNDSGTYRPNNKLLPELKSFMERNLPGLRVKTLDCQGDADEMEHMKNEQRQLRKKEGKTAKWDEANKTAKLGRGVENGTNGENGLGQKIGNAVGGPIKTLIDWDKGDKKREERAEEDDMAPGEDADERNGRAAASEKNADENQAGEKASTEKAAGEKVIGEKEAGEKAGTEEKARQTAAGDEETGEKNPTETTTAAARTEEKTSGETTAGSYNSGEKGGHAALMTNGSLISSIA